MRKSVIAGVAFGLALGCGVALAASINYVGSPYIPLATGVESYQKNAGVTGFSLTFLKGQSELILTNAGSVNGTVTLTPPAYAFDGQKNCMYSKGGIGTLTLQATSPQTLNDAITAMTAATRYCYSFSASNNSWDRFQ